tara:strand:+ start:60 stop:749 length:690 start_codon:yes stop_codon:yes gene_type:complete
MTPEDLLLVKPEVLAKLILHKRERILQSLPEIIESVATEKAIAEKLARQSRDRKEDIEPKFKNLIKERNLLIGSISQANNLESQGDDERSEFTRLLSTIKSSDTTAKEFSKLIEKLTKLCTKFDLDIQKLPDYDISIKANSALSAISKDYHIANNNWNENESHRRRLESKFNKLSTNLKDSEAAKNYWKGKINSDFDDLLVDANRVASGGPSSRQLSRNRKQINIKRRG